MMYNVVEENRRMVEMVSWKYRADVRRLNGWGWVKRGMIDGWGGRLEREGEREQAGVVVVDVEEKRTGGRQGRAGG